MVFYSPNANPSKTVFALKLHFFTSIFFGSIVITQRTSKIALGRIQLLLVCAAGSAIPPPGAAWPGLGWPGPGWPGHGWPGPGWPGLAWAGPATWLAGWRVRSLCASAQPHVLLSPSLAFPSPSLSSSLTFLWLPWLPPSALLLHGCGGRRCCRWQGHRHRSCCRCHWRCRCRCCLCCPAGFVSLRCVSVAVRRCRYHCRRPSALALSGCCGTGAADAGGVVVPVAIAAVFLVVLAVIAVVASCFVVLASADSSCAG